ncbi:hypothetical protein SuNHUV7_23580 (plasmid) [Pseudoseohaeicola sp. NH-UV-7]|uniref:hypothetical protein n=1 Tax=unclassified Sulfitobacter TaxID=196795 RepID=UPI000E0A95CC|nr:hypothetical protein [Sulfitobacter sp. JL08]AXI54898.1 hypothetical protein C1J05_10685 [Sulfitobacter sp. JL08]
MKNFTLITACLAVVAVLASADAAVAKDKSDKGKGKKDKAVQIDNKPGKGPKAVPPGQIKRYTRGAKLPKDLDFDDIDDLSKWNLKAPGKGNRYIRVDDEILEVSQDLTTVVDAVGIVGDLLK